MQTRNLILILSIGALAAFGGCERHSWEDTSRLHQAHGGDDGHGHDDGAHEDGGHEKADDADHDKEAAAHPKSDKHPELKAEEKEAAPKAEKPKGEPRKL